jgi:hypothetical protein
MLLLQQGASDWTVVVSAVASVISTIVALVATSIAARTYAQSRRDKEEELEYKRPKFKVVHESMQLVTSIDGDHTISPFFELILTFQNTRTHSASDIRLEGKSYQEDGKKLLDFVNQPVGEVDKDDTFEVRHNIPEKDLSETVIYLRLRLTYRDGKTQREYSQLLYRKFYGLPKDSSVDKIDLFELDRPEWEHYVQSQRTVIYAQRAVAKVLKKVD